MVIFVNNSLIELKELQSKYDLNYIFDRDNKYGAALKVITPFQDISVLAESHAHSAKIIMENIYDDFPGLANIDESFFDYLNKRNAIVVIMVNGTSQMIYIPSIIDSFQYESLLNFYINMIEFEKKIKRYFVFYTNISYNGKRRFTDVLELIKKRVNDDYDFQPENYISDVDKKR